MSATRLVLVRHAVPIDEARTRVYGRLDYDLSAEGRRQADELAGLLAEAALEAVYTSPLRRARDTAAPLCSRLGIGAVVVEDLREIDFGELEGLERDEALRRHPGLASWVTSPGYRFPGGESVAAVHARAVAAAAEIVERHRGAAVALVSHAIPIRAILAEALGTPLEAIFRIDSFYAGISVVDWYADGPLVRSVNAMRI